MARSLQIALVVGILALGALAVGAYAWDSSRSDRIAEGVKIAEVDVGGLSADEARALVREELVDPLARPVSVRRGGRRFALAPERLGLRADVDGMVAAALEASQEGGLPARLWRYATGATVDEAVEPRIAYSQRALDGFIDQVAEAINREPVDATIQPTATSLNPVEESDGRLLSEGELRERLRVAIRSRGHRQVTAGVERVEAEVTTEELAALYPVYLTVDRTTFQLRLWQNLELAKIYRIAVGQVGYDTPGGVYHIQTKQVDPTWYVPEREWAGNLAGEVIPPDDPRNPLEARWMGFYDGAGIHGTGDLASLGTAASHGCIRMSIPEVTELYDRVPTGAPLYIGDS